MRFLIPVIMIFTSIGCATKQQVKDMITDELAKRESKDIVKCATMDDINLIIDLHKKNYPHGCDCK